MDRTKQLHVYIKPELHKLLKIEAAKQGRSITDLLEEILEKEIEKLPKRYVYHKNIGLKVFFLWEKLYEQKPRMKKFEGIARNYASLTAVRRLICRLILRYEMKRIFYNLRLFDPKGSSLRLSEPSSEPPHGRQRCPREGQGQDHKDKYISAQASFDNRLSKSRYMNSDASAG